jgi:sulfur-oxidizing protein SoxY
LQEISMPEQIETADVNSERRLILKCLLAAGLIGGMGAAGSARAADAEGWPQQAFKQKDQDGALKELYGKMPEQSDKISLDVPEIAENGAVVPVAVNVSLPNVTSISVLVPENPFTLAASFKIPEGTEAAVSCRIKMAKTSKVIAVVESGGKLYSAAKETKVTLGGCGG